jgi:hypothetical protein
MSVPVHAPRPGLSESQVGRLGERARHVVRRASHVHICRSGRSPGPREIGQSVRVGQRLIVRRVRGLSAALCATALVSTAGLTGCSNTNCKAFAAYSLSVTVLDPAGKRVCDASVAVVDGAFSAALSPFPGDISSCTYLGPTERAGTYSIEAHSGARTGRLNAVKVTADSCHVRTRSVTITLT